MSEQPQNPLGALRAEYKALAGKNPAPNLNAEALATKIAELKARGEQPDGKEPEKAPEEAEQAAKPEKAPKGTAILDHDDKNASACHEGVEIVRGKDGKYLAPLAFVEPLLAHGFRLVGGKE